MLTAVMTICAVGFFATPFILYLLVPKPAEALRDEKLTAHVDKSWGNLEDELEKYRLDEGIQQLLALQERNDALERLVRQRFNENELTAIRYRMVAEEVRLGVISNLERLCELAQARSLIDADASRATGAGSGQESLQSDVAERMDSLLAGNEAALQALSNAVTVIAGIDTDSRPTRSELEGWIAEMERSVSVAHSQMGTNAVAVPETGSASSVKKTKPVVKPGAQ